MLNQKIANLILHKKGAIVVAALNGKEAVELLQQSNYDLLLMDLHMPEMDGFEAAAFIRTTLKSSIPIVGVTASHWEDDFEACTKIGMNTCISKPFYPDNLCDLIFKLIEEITVK